MTNPRLPVSESDPASPRTARLFRNGSNQAVRLPRDLEIDADEVLIRREGNSIILTPKPRTWDDYFSKGQRLTEDFPESVDDSPPQTREAF
ncbi:antitoxin [Thiorhodococcus mannitoliphagus]|uniref:Antitoxin n=1 Tax=Thiorhodococcus mannitoliphagus TaxID=329406 RepID=A0A6P1DZV8_9GAMM|nr:type II toxin-antitoxin system VapB family antitoxin [Thiorhodococcus mannitoliphagus]NEX22573.1 antitoxin [Thiorhodococcus mannitoliphagus]